jgi:hypothetical protein
MKPKSNFHILERRIEMGLDVSLRIEKGFNFVPIEKIFIRENGGMVEISREEWDRRFPGTEPFTVVESEDNGFIFYENITHNLGEMANAAGIYKYLWRPEELGIGKAKDLIEPLKFGLAKLKENPSRYKLLNPPNGWGSYEGLVQFVEKYLQACIDYPKAVIYVSR